MASTITGGSIIPQTTTVYGTAGTARTFIVAGTEITGGILITAPTGFEVSKDGITYGATQTIAGDGTIAETTNYVRLKATQEVGSYSGNIVLSSTGAVSFNVQVPSSTISKAPVVITADDLTKNIGDNNPTLTFKSTGLKNSETASVFTTQPTLSTTAVTDSPAGQYPITVSGAVATNYDFTYVNGKLTVAVPKPAIADLISEGDKDMQLLILQAHGVKTDNQQDGYINQIYFYDYTVSGVTAKFVVKTRFGIAQIVYVDTERV